MTTVEHWAGTHEWFDFALVDSRLWLLPTVPRRRSPAPLLAAGITAYRRYVLDGTCPSCGAQPDYTAEQHGADEHRHGCPASAALVGELITELRHTYLDPLKERR